MVTHWTDETDTEAALLFDTLSFRELRKRQDLCRAQQVIAYQKNNEDAMSDLSRMEQALYEAIGRRWHNGTFRPAPLRRV